MLIGRFWGTGDAAAIPAPYCDCKVCKEARELGGKTQRLRSCFQLTDKIMIDLGVDATAQSARYGSLSGLEHVIVTHTHADHLSSHMVMETIWSKTETRKRNYYLTDKAYDIVDNWRESEWIVKGALCTIEERGLVEFHKAEYGIRYSVDDIAFTAFRGNHTGNVGENSALYLIELPNGKTLFYGLDSGPYFPETVEALKKYKIDIFITEATCGVVAQSGIAYHMSLDGVFDLVNTLYKNGTLTSESVAYLTHINHSSSHAQMLSAVEKMNFPIETVVAFDGLKIF